MTEILFRSFPSTIERSSPETLTARIVPYGVKASVVEMGPDGVEQYEEAFAPGAFARQASSTETGVIRRVNLVDEHEGGSGKLGIAVALRDSPDALAADFMILPTRRADVDALLASGVSDVSIGFVPLRSGTSRMRDGTRLRQRAHLVHVALVAAGAYPGAEVLAFRDAAEADAEDAAIVQDRDRERLELAGWLEQEKARNDAWREKVARPG